jgi:tetratricopeptide (TPR) repeat protein
MNPFQAGGTKVTIRSVWDAASEDLEQGKFNGTPFDEQRIQYALGAGYWALGVYGPAESHCRRALEICLTHLGPDHPATLGRMKNLGWIYFYQSRFKEAEQLFEKALQGMQRLEHDGRWHTMASLATVYHYQGRFQDAEKLSLEALDAVHRVMGEEWTVVYHLGLASSYTLEGRYSEAEERLRKGLEIGRELHPTNWYTLDLKHIFGELCRLMGRYGQAEKLLNEAFIGRRDVWGEENADTLRTMRYAQWFFLAGCTTIKVAMRRLNLYLSRFWRRAGKC